jgi:hypothetical protein
MKNKKENYMKKDSTEIIVGILLIACFGVQLGHAINNIFIIPAYTIGLFLIIFGHHKKMEIKIKNLEARI